VRAAAARLVVVDSYTVTADDLRAVRAAVPAIYAVIDDFGDRRLPCDFVLNGNLWADDVDRARFGGATPLFGPEFALLRPDFDPVRRPAGAGEASEPTVLVTLGGGQLGAVAVQLAAAIDALDRSLRILLLVAATGPVVEAAERLQAHGRHRIEVHRATHDVGALLARAHLAVAAAGTTCFELAAMGVPGLLLVAADNQRRGAPVWAASGAFALLGDLDTTAPSIVADAVAALIAAPERRRTMAACGPRLVPGDGAARVAELLVQRLVTAQV
ncbi:MAG: hypothetical protein KDC98_05545, partial [Planctomycetes bacterium]|nr:hypothetical protein [Planctomycetota bacterium]